MDDSDKPATPAGDGAPAVADQLHEIARLSRAFERRVAQALLVNTTDLAALESLMTEGPLTPSELARRLDVTTAATTLVVDRLVALGHVERLPHARDRRKVVVKPAPASVTRAALELMPVTGGVALLAADLGEAERKVVEGFLAGVLDVYRSALRVHPGLF